MKNTTAQSGTVEKTIKEVFAKDMKIDQFITHLRKDKNIIIGCDNGELKVNANKKDMTDDIIRELRSRKTEIVSFFETFNNSNGGSQLIPLANQQEYYALSPAQRRMY
ncbi:MAG: hypothetical protein WBA74_06675, partial [Cyclobacteriaceae bacterium]